jgi:hypothetical protein
MSKKESAPKSAYELAMERLQAEDRAAGIEHQPLTARQKDQIADVRQKAKASLAEIEIRRGNDLVESEGDPEKVREIEEHFEIDRRRIEDRVEDDVAAIKKR